jgi:SPP1 family predicted phage head-tail adaptor
MNPPNLNKRVTIVRYTYASDGVGGQTATVASSDVWAAVSNISGNESYRFSSSESNVRYKFTVRYRPIDIVSNDDEVQYASRTFRIRHIDYGDFTRDYITLYCEEDNAP